MIKKKQKKNSGFTILEVMVALGLLTMGLLGVVSLIIQSSQARNINQNYLVASMLAQEGAELIRNKRDYNWLKFTYDKWKESGTSGSDYDIIPEGLNGTSTFAVDYSGSIDDTPNFVTDAQAKLWLNGSGFYSHTGASSTPFSRLVTVYDNGSSVDVEVDVQWQERGRTHDYVVTMELYNWR